MFCPEDLVSGDRKEELLDDEEIEEPEEEPEEPEED